MNTPLTPDQLREAASKHPARLLRKAWGEFIARWPWEWFVTLTFTADTHPERAKKLFRVWVSQINREIYGIRWSKREPYGVVWVLAVEYQKSGRIHLHALVSGVGEARRLDWMDHWFDLDQLAGYPRIFPVENSIAVANYVTKYVTKGGEIDFSRNLRLKHADLFDPAPSTESDN